MDRPGLIDELVGDLGPVRRPTSPAVGAGLWLAAAWATVTVMTLATGAMRAGAMGQLAASPRFLLESLLGFVVGAVALHGALALGTPAPHAWRRIAPGLVAASLWVAALAYGLHDPALAPSALGARAHCFAETFLYSLPPLALALVMLRGRAALRRGWTAALAGLAAAAVPALMMEFACMYDPVHILTMHLSPVPVVMVVGAALGIRFLPRI
jgi:hypothetical protein